MQHGLASSHVFDACCRLSLAAAVSSRGSWEESSSSSQPSLTALNLHVHTLTHCLADIKGTRPTRLSAFSLSPLHYCTSVATLYLFLHHHHHPSSNENMLLGRQCFSETLVSLTICVCWCRASGYEWPFSIHFL